MTANSDNQDRLTATRKHQPTPSPDADPAKDHFNRSISRLRKSEWDKARSELTAAQDGGFDVAATFMREYKSAGEFEDSFDVELPPDIADIVDPISEEEDAAFVRAMEEGRDSGFVSRDCIMSILRN